MWLSAEARRVREPVPHLDGQAVMNEHLLHHLVEEVLLLWVGPGCHHLLEIVDERHHCRAFEGVRMWRPAGGDTQHRRPCKSRQRFTLQWAGRFRMVGGASCRVVQSRYWSGPSLARKRRADTAGVGEHDAAPLSFAGFLTAPGLPWIATLGVVSLLCSSVTR